MSKEAANAVRALSFDAVQKANSGHPGMPMGMADIATVLWQKFLKHNPGNPLWPNRDRFVLSNGHGSMLLYALLYLSGYDLNLGDIKQFRQLNSKTPGHPEYGDTPGVETTTGPLGQGLANAVGMAIAERCLAEQFNREQLKPIDHMTYAFIGDGCLMEGISHEVSSLAGTLGLGKLIVFYDDNNISIDGEVSDWFSDDTPKRFEAYGWHVIANVDGHDPAAIEQAIIDAQQQHNKPSLLCCKTVIGYGAPHLEGTAKTHGSPLGEVEIAATRERLNWIHPPFEIPDTILSQWDGKQAGNEYEQTWLQLMQEYQRQYPQLHQELTRRLQQKLPETWDAAKFIHRCSQSSEKLATRKASQLSLDAYGPELPELFGGSADLAGSNNTFWSQSKPITREDFTGNYLHYGVREFGMAAIMNGLALHGGFIPYGGTFLVFSDYARNAIRLSAMMQQRVIYVLTHDSIGLGEDGPTHQPVEHAAMLRLTPGLTVWRPADLTETAVAWQQALLTQGPSCLLLSRQGLPALSHPTTDDIAKGAYVIHQAGSSPDGLLIATGSEVHLALQAAQKLEQKGQHWRVISMPCTESFDAQTKEYKEYVLPKHLKKRIAIEAASTDYWWKYVGFEGAVIGMNRFGASAPANQLYDYFDISVENIVSTALTLEK